MKRRKRKNNKSLLVIIVILSIAVAVILNLNKEKEPTPIEPNTSKEENAKAVYQKIESANQKGIQFTPNITGHEFGYKYIYLTVSNTSYHSLNSAFKANKNDLQNEIDSTFSNAIYVTLPGYGVYPSYDELLTEEICNEYHLVCSKW